MLLHSINLFCVLFWALWWRQSRSALDAPVLGLDQCRWSMLAYYWAIRKVVRCLGGGVMATGKYRPMGELWLLANAALLTEATSTVLLSFQGNDAAHNGSWMSSLDSVVAYLLVLLKVEVMFCWHCLLLGLWTVCNDSVCCLGPPCTTTSSCEALPCCGTSKLFSEHCN